MNLRVRAAAFAILFWGASSVTESEDYESAAGAYLSPYALSLTVPRERYKSWGPRTRLQQLHILVVQL